MGQFHYKPMLCLSKLSRGALKSFLRPVFVIMTLRYLKPLKKSIEAITERHTEPLCGTVNGDINGAVDQSKGAVNGDISGAVNGTV